MQIAARGTPSLRSISPPGGLAGGLSTPRRCSHQVTLKRNPVRQGETILHVGDANELPSLAYAKPSRVTQIIERSLRIFGLLNDKGKQVYRLPNIPLTSQNNLSTVILNFSVTAP
jgi:hypothetical protein